MSLENDDQPLPRSAHESKPESRNLSKISYTRDFLLSFQDLDICKKFPSGFDASILSEFEDASNSVFERQRSAGGLSFQSSRHGDYVSLPPNRLDNSGSYSRGSSGRWDTRSSGSSDRDGEPDRESYMADSARRFGNQSRRFWQHPEHDGLLGSGAFPRPSGYSGASAPKGRGNGHYQLNRSSEPYQPPRPHKAVSFSRKDGSDFCNDETFGSSECSSQDREEEERKRRESFELLRKEQQKALKEKQKQTYNTNEKLDADILALLEKSVDKKGVLNETDKSDGSVASLLSQTDSSRSSFYTQASASRPLVPPGFANALTEKNLCVQSSGATLALEGKSAVIGDNLLLDGTDNDPEKRNMSAACVDVNVQKSDPMSSSVILTNEYEKLVIPSSGVDVNAAAFENIASMAYVLQKADQVWENDVAHGHLNQKEAKSEVMNTVSQDQSTSILEKLFGSALSKSHGGSPTYVENQGLRKDEETWCPVVPESSKFAHWFEEEKKPVEDYSSRDLLSLIVNNEKVGSQSSVVSNDKAIEHIQPSSPFKNSDTALKLIASPATSLMVGIPEPYHLGDKPDPSPVVLTCEDLEQFILAEVKDSSSSPQHSEQGPRNVLASKSEELKADVDNHASQHLLSLLQKGAKQETISPPMLDMGFFNRLAISDVHASPNSDFTEHATASNIETVPSSEKTLTLEALFGAAFMNELHSLDAPVSVQRGSAGGINDTDVALSHGLPFSHADDGFLSSSSGEYQSNKAVLEGDVLSHIQEARGHNAHGPGVEYGNSPIKGAKLGGVGFEEGALEIQLPEEDSLITVSDSATSDPLPFVNANKTEELLPAKTLVELSDKFLNAIPRDAEHIQSLGLDGPPVLRGPYDQVDSDNLYHHLQGGAGRPSSQIPHLMNHTRPLLPQLDHVSSRNQQMKFFSPEGIPHDPQHPFPANVFPHNAFNSGGGPRFDPTSHPMMLQHMPLPGNFPPHYQLQGLPRGVPLSHPISHMPGYMSDITNVHSFPLHHQQPNYGGLGMGMPGPVIGEGGGGRHPEALERLIEMELRAKPKPIHPAAAGHIPGIYGPEVDMNFRYR